MWIGQRTVYVDGAVREVCLEELLEGVALRVGPGGGLRDLRSLLLLYFFIDLKPLKK